MGWAYRTVCHNCKKMWSKEHLNGSNFWSRTPCPKCGEKRTTELGRFVPIYREFKWYNPKTWFPTGYNLEIK